MLAASRWKFQIACVPLLPNPILTREKNSYLRKEREMENDRLSTYLQARLRAVTYKCDDGLDDEAVRPRPLPEQQRTERQQRQSEMIM